MKKFTLLFTVLFFFALSYGQQFKPSTSITPYSSFEKKMNEPAEPRLKGEGDIFFTETFNWKDPSNERGWSLPAGWQIVEETDYGMPWIWRSGTDSIRGRWTFEKGHKYSKTPEDGFLVLPVDEYNYVDGIQTDFYPISYIQLPPIDCSARPTVVLKMRQYFRCNPETKVKVLVSNDLGAHWATYSLAYGTILNIFCKNPYVEVNLTDVAAGMPNVWIRFVWDAMRYYFWAIDDLTLSEAFDNEIQLEQPWLYMADLETNDDEGFFYMVPAAQAIDGFGGYTFKAGFLNAGKDDQESCFLNAEVYKNGVSVYNQNSVARDIWALQRDTFPITTPFIPDGYGNYDMVLTAKQKQTDGLPANNIFKDTYYITDSIYSISDWEFETYSSVAGFNNSDGDYLGVEYDIKTRCEANSISTLIMQRPENHIASTKPGYNFQYWLYWYNPDDAVWIELLSSEYIEVTQEMLDKWITLPLQKDGESEFLEPGKYIAAIQMYHGGGANANNSLYRFTIGSDNSHKQSLAKSLYHNIIDDISTWYQNRDVSMIRLNLNNTGAPASAEVVFNVDMKLPIANGYFKPANGDFVDVAGTINGWNGSAHHLTDADGDGIYTLTVPGLPTFQNIEYKYRINGDWNTSEFPSGGANRVYRVSYYNMLNDIYNNGVSMEVELNRLNSSIQVFPNPNEGIFTLAVSNERVSDLNIQVTNIQGQTVYQNLVKSTLEYQETINLTQFAKGMYFLKVNNQVIKLLVD
ncbi:MAG: T9SS type A sorting domain-containing protein [Bacteroidales bacterium]|jgi:hypothetical protein